MWTHSEADLPDFLMFHFLLGRLEKSQAHRSCKLKKKPFKSFFVSCLPSVHSQVYLFGPSVHLAPFLHGVLAHSSMSIWQRVPVKPGKTTRGCYCVHESMKERGVCGRLCFQTIAEQSLS